MITSSTTIEEIVNDHVEEMLGVDIDSLSAKQKATILAASCILRAKKRESRGENSESLRQRAQTELSRY